MTSTLTNSTNNDRLQQLRKVAILVATLDEPLAERLLADLPAREEDAVRKIVEQLGEIDPNEYRAVVADFRQGVAPPQTEKPAPSKTPPSRMQLDGVELDPSLLARMDDEDFSTAIPTTKQNESPWQTLSDADATTLVEMLSAEQPQTVAIVLSRLETPRAAELIGKLSPTLQTEVLTRLADLDPADEQTLEVVASQLAQWLNAHRQRRQRMAAGCDLVQRILQDTPDSQRSVLLTRLGERNPALAEKLSAKPNVSSPAVQQFPNLSAAAAYRSSSGVTTSLAEKHSHTTAQSSDPQSSDPLTELESLDDQELLRALQQADRQTVMLALAGSSESLMKRIVKDLPRRKANQFRQQVRAMGPTRLSDILSAQRELLRCGRESRVVSRESRENLPFTTHNS